LLASPSTDALPRRSRCPEGHVCASELRFPDRPLLESPARRRDTAQFSARLDVKPDRRRPACRLTSTSCSRTPISSPRTASPSPRSARRQDHVRNVEPLPRRPAGAAEPVLIVTTWRPVSDAPDPRGEPAPPLPPRHPRRQLDRNGHRRTPDPLPQSASPPIGSDHYAPAPGGCNRGIAQVPRLDGGGLHSAWPSRSGRAARSTSMSRKRAFNDALARHRYWRTLATSSPLQRPRAVH